MQHVNVKGLLNMKIHSLSIMAGVMATRGEYIMMSVSFFEDVTTDSDREKY